MSNLVEKGTITTNGSAEQAVGSSLTNNRIYMLVLSRSAQQAGDTIRVKTNVRLSSSSPTDAVEVFETAIWTGAPANDTPGQETKVAMSPAPQPAITGGVTTFTITRTGGSDRAYDFWILEV